MLSLQETWINLLYSNRLYSFAICNFFKHQHLPGTDLQWRDSNLSSFLKVSSLCLMGLEKHERKQMMTELHFLGELGL